MECPCEGSRTNLGRIRCVLTLRTGTTDQFGTADHLPLQTAIVFRDDRKRIFLTHKSA
ncbi:hypothetical protein RB12803 [Rhodopirellula baltica SH 1]|uniref:Uncharacterized protein n=1 Tax=Rhodopirellula baltica (strain DSM 10527 / NCIMB 13988 / SH1) TaxID=243090 RepID=Q7UI26_RHOBA|nr:hypothetical protein RB12803 [Rhodopirellula baltica SH 1]